MSGTTGYITKSATGTVTAGNGLSAYFSDSQYCTLPKSTDYDVSDGDWTFEFWFNWSKGNTMSSSAIGIANNRRNAGYWGEQVGNGWQLGFVSPDYPYDGSTLTNFFLSTDGGDISSSSFNAISIPQNTWHHIALVKNGSGANNATFYLDGVNVDVATAPTWSAGISDVFFGKQPLFQFGGDPNMKISNFRLSTEAVYTEDFTPSTSPLIPLPSTKILTFQSTFYNTGSTGGDITNYGTRMVREGPWFTTGQQYNDFGDYFIRRDLVGLTVPTLPLEEYDNAPGYVYTWGVNDYGQLGDGTTSTSNTASNYLTSTYKDVESMVYANMAIKNDGTLWTWGRNLAGNLGINNTDNGYSVSSPVQTYWGGNNWYKTLESNSFATNGFGAKGALKTDGTLWIWGTSVWGETAGGAAYAPREVYGGGTNWKKARFDTISSFGLKTDGTVWGWGYSYGDVLFSGGNTSIPTQTGSNATDWSDITTAYLVFAGIKTDGTLWTWGDNLYGQLGEGTTTNANTPQQVQGTWRLVTGGLRHLAGIKTDGTLWTWGRNESGQLGDGTIVDKSSPVQTLAGGTDWKSVRCTNTGVYATKTDGSLWAWGADVLLGDGTPTQTVSSPVMSSVGGWTKVVGEGIGLRSSTS